LGWLWCASATIASVVRASPHQASYFPMGKVKIGGIAPFCRLQRKSRASLNDFAMRSASSM
jgi:hypothetical protein